MHIFSFCEPRECGHKFSLNV